MMNTREHTKYILTKSGYQPEERRCCSRRCKCCFCVLFTSLLIAGAAAAIYFVFFHSWGPTEVCTNGVYLTNNTSSSDFVVNSKIGIKILPSSGDETHYIRATVTNGTEEELVYNLEENIDRTWTMFTENSSPVTIPDPGLPVNEWLYLSFNRNNDTDLAVELKAGNSSYTITLDVSEVLEPNFSIVMGGYNHSAPYEVSFNC